MPHRRWTYTRYTHDTRGHLTSLTDPIHANSFTWAYGADGQVVTAVAPNANSTAFTYDPLGRLLTTVTGTRASYTSTYNRAGGRLTEASTITGDPGNGTATTGYDPLDRLINYSLPGIRTIADTWQAVPSRDTQTLDGVPSAQGFDAANRPNTNSYTYDADGRMTARPGSSGGALEWDSLGRLVRVRATPGGTIIATYAYDALDRLLTVERSGSRIRFRYAGTTTAVAGVVDDIGGTVIRNVATGPDGTVLLDWLGTSRRLYGVNGHHDTTWTSDDTGAVTATARYDPWGNIVRSSGTLPDWRFQGSWADTTTNLAWAVARWYDPVQGTFISEDTLLGSPENPGSRHLYAYGAGDPVGSWDPSGQVTVAMSPYNIVASTGTRIVGQDYAFAVSRGSFLYSGPTLWKVMSVAVSVDKLRVEGSASPLGLGALGWYRHLAYAHLAVADTYRGVRLYEKQMFEYEYRCAYAWPFGIFPVTLCTPWEAFPKIVYDQAGSFNIYRKLLHNVRYRVDFWITAISDAFLAESNTVFSAEGIRARVQY